MKYLCVFLYIFFLEVFSLWAYKIIFQLQNYRVYIKILVDIKVYNIETK